MSRKKEQYRRYQPTLKDRVASKSQEIRQTLKEFDQTVIESFISYFIRQYDQFEDQNMADASWMIEQLYANTVECLTEQVYPAVDKIIYLGKRQILAVVDDTAEKPDNLNSISLPGRIGPNQKWSERQILQQRLNSAGLAKSVEMLVMTKSELVQIELRRAGILGRTRYDLAHQKN